MLIHHRGTLFGWWTLLILCWITQGHCLIIVDTLLNHRYFDWSSLLALGWSFIDHQNFDISLFETSCIHQTQIKNQGASILYKQWYYADKLIHALKLLQSENRGICMTNELLAIVMINQTIFLDNSTKYQQWSSIKQTMSLDQHQTRIKQSIYKD